MVGCGRAAGLVVSIPWLCVAIGGLIAAASASPKHQTVKHQRVMYRFMKGTDEDRSSLIKMIVSYNPSLIQKAVSILCDSIRSSPIKAVQSISHDQNPLGYKTLPDTSPPHTHPPTHPPQPHIAQGSWVIRSAVGTTPVIVARKLATKFYFTEKYVEVCVDVGSNGTANYVTGGGPDGLTTIRTDLMLHLFAVTRPPHSVSMTISPPHPNSPP